MIKNVLIAVVIILLSNTTKASVMVINFDEGTGVGISFGTSIAKTDVGGYIPMPISRLFGRYQMMKSFAIESGFGFGMLEGDKFGFFSSKIIPIDIRLIIHPGGIGRIRPLLFSGFSLMNFNPVDRDSRPLPNNEKGKYSHWMGVLPIGASLQYFITENSIIELTAMYGLGTKDYLDDQKLHKNNDGYYLFGINVYAFFESGNSDRDGDGLINKLEYQYGTDPDNPDTDGDRLQDGEEINIHRTNPLNKDTDDDRLNDYEEIFSYRTNPNNADTDGDKLIDGDEILIYKTNPLMIDTDGDKLTDGDEVLIYKSDPLIIDTDGDELSDYEEVMEFKTNPILFDTDGGGMPDGKEVKLGFNPKDMSDDTPAFKVGQKIVLEGVNFEYGSANLTTESIKTLEKVAAGLIANPEVEVEISGHTDNIGSINFNTQLSLRRAESVKTYLVGKGISPDRIKAIGHGPNYPIGDNGTEEGRALNRRIEFLRIK